jgi:acyl-CoA synthetase (NDP forming)
VSFGNAVVLDAPDYIEYLANDPETEVIAMYVEGVKDGRRFLEPLRRATEAKPVVVWKGGSRRARARRSHTAPLATAPAIWDAAMRQAGVVQTKTRRDDRRVNARHAKPTTGRRIGLMR